RTDRRSRDGVAGRRLQGPGCRARWEWSRGASSAARRASRRTAVATALTHYGPGFSLGAGAAPVVRCGTTRRTATDARTHPADARLAGRPPPRRPAEGRTAVPAAPAAHLRRRLPGPGQRRVRQAANAGRPEVLRRRVRMGVRAVLRRLPVPRDPRGAL